MNWEEPTSHPLWASFESWRSQNYRPRVRDGEDYGLKQMLWEAFVAGSSWTYYLPGSN